MGTRRWLAVVTGLAWLAGSSCTTLREIPRGEYDSTIGHKPVRVYTTEGLEYELETASIEGDTLVGYHRKDVEGPVDEYDTFRLPLDQVSRISARRIDWYRTGLIGGAVLGVVVAAGLSARKSSNSGDTSSPIGCKNCTPQR